MRYRTGEYLFLQALANGNENIYTCLFLPSF